MTFDILFSDRTIAARRSKEKALNSQNFLFMFPRRVPWLSTTSSFLPVHLDRGKRPWRRVPFPSILLQARSLGALGLLLSFKGHGSAPSFLDSPPSHPVSPVNLGTGQIASGKAALGTPPLSITRTTTLAPRFPSFRFENTCHIFGALPFQVVLPRKSSSLVDGGQLKVGVD